MAVFFLLLASASLAYAEEVPPLDCPEQGQVCREPQTLLPARVLTRPYSFIYKVKDASPENVLSDDVAAFSPLYVFAREDMDFWNPRAIKGWYRVGVSSSGEPLGWMQAKDVVEWRQALVLSFTHPGVGEEARRAVIFFENSKLLDELTNLEDDARKARAEELYKAVQAAVEKRGEVPEGVVSVEPGPFVDIKEQFYMLPILQFEDLGARFIDDAKHLQVVAVAETRAEGGEPALPQQVVAADKPLSDVARPGSDQKALLEASGGKAGSGQLRDISPKNGSQDGAPSTDIAPDKQGGNEALSDVPTAGIGTSLSGPMDLDAIPLEGNTGALSSAESKSPSLKELAADIVFVMDMTTSMVPFIKNATEAIENVARQLTADPELSQKVRFGIVGYRDDVQKMPHLKFTAKNFTPDGTLEVNQFLQVMESINREMGEFAKDADAQRIGSGDYPEEVYAGVREALATQWSEPALRFIVLVGDASAHEVGHEQNTTSLDATSLRQRLNADQINLLALHLKEERAVADHSMAEEQYTVLATNQGMEEATYFSVPAMDLDSYNQTVTKMAGGLTRFIEKARAGDVEALAAEAAGTPEGPEQEGADEVETAVAKLGYAALLPYLGKATTPPRDFLAWAFDRDLMDPAKRALDVRVLLTRHQVNDLVFTAEKVSQALKAAELTQMEFFDALQSTTLVGVKGQDISYDKVQQLRGSGLSASWLESLPYKSTILNLNNDVYAAMSPDERAEIENGLDAKLKLYRELLANSDIWIKPREDGPDEDRFYPLELTSLP